MAQTMFEKIWNSHVITEQDGNTILYIDRHLVHEVTSPQAFEGLRMGGAPSGVLEQPMLCQITMFPPRTEISQLLTPSQLSK